jgi:drug/metabolite transporter (DMT)-like permease
MLASAPLFAASFLVTKALTRYENTGTILVWQAITVSLFSLPLALINCFEPQSNAFK